MKQRAVYPTVVLLFAFEAGAQAASPIYAATTSGPYKSTDGGATWQPVKVTVTNGLLQGVPGMAAVAVDPLNPANVYFLGAVTGTSAFYKSTDAGQTWPAVLLPGVNRSTYAETFTTEPKFQ